MKTLLDAKEKRAEISRRALYFMKAPHIEKVLLNPLAKKLEGVCRFKCKFQLPEPGTGLGYQWSYSPPRPIRLANAEPGMVGPGAPLQTMFAKERAL